MGIIWASVLATGIAVVLWKAFKSQKGKEKLDKIPGSLGLPFVGEFLSFLAATRSDKGVYHFVTVRRQRYGNWFKTRILRNTTVFVPTIQGAKVVYANDFELFNKGYVKSMGDMVGKKSLFIVPKSHHQKIRHLLAHPFSLNHLSQFVPKFDKLVSERLHKLERQGNSFPVLGFTMKVGFDSICDVLLSITDVDQLAAIESDCKAVSDAMLTLPLMIPGTLYYKGIKARERLMKRFKDIIDDRRSGKVESNDFVQLMVDPEKDSNPDEEEERLDDEEIMDNLLTTMLSGQNTTATAMMWSVKFISDNKPVQDQLREEALSILARKPEGTFLTYQDVSKMSYTSKVIKETLRTANIVLWFPRVALQDCTVDGVEIQKGWHVNVDAKHIHFDPAIYPDPLCFNPSRFDEMPKPYTYIPFGSGARTCLGINMAKVTMSIFLHRLTSRYQWKVDNHDSSFEPKGFIPKLKSGYPITLTPLNK